MGLVMQSDPGWNGARGGVSEKYRVYKDTLTLTGATDRPVQTLPCSMAVSSFSWPGNSLSIASSFLGTLHSTEDGSGYAEMQNRLPTWREQRRSPTPTPRSSE